MVSGGYSTGVIRWPVGVSPSSRILQRLAQFMSGAVDVGLDGAQREVEQLRDFFV